jgi:hypothetical protein
MSIHEKPASPELTDIQDNIPIYEELTIDERRIMFGSESTRIILFASWERRQNNALEDIESDEHDDEKD